MPDLGHPGIHFATAFPSLYATPGSVAIQTVKIASSLTLDTKVTSLETGQNPEGGGTNQAGSDKKPAVRKRPGDTLRHHGEL